MDSSSWKCDDYGTQNLRPTINGCTGHVWIQGRRPYCDRGHWEWGFEGLYVRPDDLPNSSYYFMRHERLLLEAEAWLARAAGGVSTSRHIAQLDEGTPMQHGASPKLHGVWQKLDEHTLVADLPHKDGFVQARIVEQPGKSGSVFVFTTEHLSLDASDRFPRCYLDLDRCMAEAEEFFAWRLLRIPAETPGLLQEPERPIGPTLQQALEMHQPSQPRPRRAISP